MANNMPGFASDIAADPLGQRRYNIPNLPFKDMRRQGPVDRLDESVGEATRGMPSMGPFADRLKRLFPQGQMPPELLQMLMMQLMGSQGGSMTPMGGGRAPQRPPMGGGRAPQRPPMGGGRPPQRPPMGGSRPPVVKLEDLMAAMTQGPPGTQQANMPVPQARGRIGR
tara:strand:+ start:1232 stop:1735 length:504 start_codon:yes stop_codon:yes gene_type:complete